jgi:hypothetical protein
VWQADGMGNRDKGNREKKKPKKVTPKVAPQRRDMNPTAANIVSKLPENR